MNEVLKKALSEMSNKCWFCESPREWVLESKPFDQNLHNVPAGKTRIYYTPVCNKHNTVECSDAVLGFMESKK